jgi:hypothetical protein
MERDDYARPATPPDTLSLSAMREAAKDCEACHLPSRDWFHCTTLNPSAKVLGYSHLKLDVPYSTVIMSRVLYSATNALRN